VILQDLTPLITRFQSFARRVGSPLIFGLDPVELGQYLAERELKLIDDVGAAEYQERYLPCASWS